MNIQTDEHVLVGSTICEDSHDRNIVCDVGEEDKSERTTEVSRQDHNSDEDSLNTMMTTPSVGSFVKQSVGSQFLTGEEGYQLNDRGDMNVCHWFVLFGFYFGSSFLTS